MQGKATIAGQPLHPILVTVPVGCFVAAVAADVVSIWAGPAFFPAMATWLVAFGTIGALIAALPGIVDYLTVPMSHEAKSLASWHMMLNFAAILIFGTAFAMRYGHYSSSAGHALTALGFVVLLVSGTLGGRLAHRYGAGVREAGAAAAPQRRSVRDETQTVTQRGVASR